MRINLFVMWMGITGRTHGIQVYHQKTWCLSAKEIWKKIPISESLPPWSHPSAASKSINKIRNSWKETAQFKRSLFQITCSECFLTIVKSIFKIWRNDLTTCPKALSSSTPVFAIANQSQQLTLSDAFPIPSPGQLRESNLVSHFAIIQLNIDLPPIRIQDRTLSGLKSGNGCRNSRSVDSLRHILSGPFSRSSLKRNNFRRLSANANHLASYFTIPNQ